MENKICAYCDLPIEDKRYTYKWFAEEQVMKPVHNEHLIFSRKAEPDA